MKIRRLNNNDIPRAMELKISCWNEELAGKAENTLKLEKEISFWTNWMNTPDEHNDIRLLLGAYNDLELAGVAFASFIDTKDTPENGIELNGLWVFPQWRGKGISLKLILETVNFFLPLGVTKMEIYNHHYAPSNSFYKNLGGKVIANEYQMEGKLLVDIFEFDITAMKKLLEEKILRY